MTHTPTIVSKNIIFTYARKIRNVQSEQIDPYIKLIEQELIKIYPELKDREDNALNWAYDIINSASNTDVSDTLTRLDDIITNERKSQWVCDYCGKNYSSANSLKTHIKWHTGDLKHKCSFCEKKFRNHSELRRHEMVHTGNIFKLLLFV